MTKADINKDRLLETFTDLLRINSPSFEERELGAFLAQKLKGLGFSITRQRYDMSFNIIASKKGRAPGVPALLLSAHMDTIEPTLEIAFSLDNKKVRSTGSTVLGADDKSAIAQILEAMTMLQEQNIQHGDVEIVFTSAEEKGLHGAKNLDFRKIKSRHALVLDSSGPVGRIVVAGPSQISYEMQITGKPAHAGIEPEKGISAIRAAAEVIAAVPDGRIDPVTTANIGVIRGGTATNVVSRDVTIKGEVRSHDPAILRSTQNAIFDRAGEITKNKGAKLRIKLQKEYQAFRIRDREPFLLYMGDIFMKSGIRPEHVVTGGGSDANIFNQHGIVALNLSTGMQKVHSHDEFIHIKDLVSGSLIVASAVANFVQFRK